MAWLWNSSQLFHTIIFVLSAPQTSKKQKRWSGPKMEKYFSSGFSLSEEYVALLLVRGNNVSGTLGGFIRVPHA